MDLDDVFVPKLQALIRSYHARCKDKILAAMQGDPNKDKWLPNNTIGDRNLIEKLGGWRNLQWAEDWDLWSRVAKKGCYAWTVFPVVKTTNPHLERQRIMPKLLFRFYKYRELLRARAHIF